MTEIEVGRWYRWTRYGETVKVTEDSGGVSVYAVGLDGYKRAALTRELVPWSPTAGEHVRCVKYGTVLTVMCEKWGAEVAALGRIEPCLPPVEAKPEAYTMTKEQLAEAVKSIGREAIQRVSADQWRPLGNAPKAKPQVQTYDSGYTVTKAELTRSEAEGVLRQLMSRVAAESFFARAKQEADMIEKLAGPPVANYLAPGYDDPLCPKCHQSTYTGLEGRDHACPPLEPEVTEVAINLGRWCDEANHRVGREVGFKATGHGHSAFHPTREGAIAMWKAAVRR